MERQSSLKGNLETLKLELGGYHAYLRLPHSTHGNGSNALGVTAPNDEPTANTSMTAWKGSLDSALKQLSSITQQSRKLRTFHIRAWNYPSPDPLDSPEDYLSLPTIKALLSVENLSVLVVDLTVSFMDSPEEQENVHHICPAIGTLLSTLRTLHLRMRTICPGVLKLRDSKDSLRLSEVVINLSLMTDVAETTSASHSQRCKPQDAGLPALKADIREQAEALASRMACPKLIRILTHSLPQFELQSLDVLTGKTMILDDDMAWNDDGKMIEEESGSESELSDDEFATWLDD